jgi:DNA-binding transcriptional regulator GbsR (MarR family)
MQPITEIHQIIKDFVFNWGNIACNWGIPKTMGQIHGLLLVSHKPLNADEIIANLELSRGSVHTQLQQLLEWKLIYKVAKSDDRKDYFIAEKDMWKLFLTVVNIRKNMELQPLLELMNNQRTDHLNCEMGKEFEKVIKDISAFSNRANQMLETLKKVDNFRILSNVSRTLENK